MYINNKRNSILLEPNLKVGLNLKKMEEETIEREFRDYIIKILKNEDNCLNINNEKALAIADDIINIKLKSNGMMITPREIYNAHYRMFKEKILQILSRHNVKNKNVICRMIHREYLVLIGLEGSND